MGVGGGFWELLKPVEHRASIEDVRGMRVAVDLSLWIVQHQTALKANARKPHLRLAFFRTVNLYSKLSMFPVFIVDGEAPALKSPVRLCRFRRICKTDLTYLAKEETIKRNFVFNTMVEECVELLELMGMPVLRAKGEAEALCALLNREQLVDACITTDSDAFLHGATFVIKNIQADCKDPIIECYKASDINTRLGLKRKHLIAIALLVGCDYSMDGVPGIGLTTAVRLVQSFPEEDVLNKLHELHRGNVLPLSETEVPKIPHMESDLVIFSPTKRKCHCSCCGHLGTKSNHTKFGCEDCKKLYNETCVKKQQGFKCACESCKMEHSKKVKTKYLNWTKKTIAKICATEGFPNEDIISIFLKQEIFNISELKMSWENPQMEHLENFLQSQLFWPSTYTRRKVLPLCSAMFLREMAMRNQEKSKTKEGQRLLCHRYVPNSIVRTKVRYTQTFYVLKWEAVNIGTTTEDWLGCRNELEQAMLSSDTKEEPVGDANEPEAETLEGGRFITTDENMQLLMSACPELVEKFKHEKEMARQRKTTLKGKRKDVLKGKRKDVTTLKGKRKDVSKNQLSITSYFKLSKHFSLSKCTNSSFINLDDGDVCQSIPSTGKKDHSSSSFVTAESKRVREKELLLQTKPSVHSFTPIDDDVEILELGEEKEPLLQTKPTLHNFTPIDNDVEILELGTSNFIRQEGTSQRVRRCLF